MTGLAAYRASLTKSALVGTRLSSPKLIPPPPFDIIPDAKPEEQILSGAAVLGLTQTAGRIIPTSSAPLPAASPPETRPYISPAAAWRAGEIFQNRAAILGEWFAAVERNGKIVPPVLLPDVLQRASRFEAERLVILSICGERGRWLAQLNPEWSEMIVPSNWDQTELWQNGTRAERFALFEEMLAKDDGRAREWLQSAWDTEDPKDRVRFLKLLKSHVKPPDEPFLEVALNSKVKDVREAALEALLLLPESALVDRSFHAAGACLSFVSGKLEVVLPESFEKSWKRDGLQESVPGYMQKLGPRAYWLRQLLERVPPSRWTSLWNTTPEELCQASGEWAEALVPGWLSAAIHFGDEAWSRYFIYRALTDKQPPQPALFRQLSDEECESVARKYLNSINTKSELYALGPPTLNVLPFLFSPLFSAHLLATMRRLAESGPDWTSAYVGTYVQILSVRLSPELWRELGQDWPEALYSNPRWPSILDDLQSRLQFRYEMLKELES